MTLERAYAPNVANQRRVMADFNYGGLVGEDGRVYFGETTLRAVDGAAIELREGMRADSVGLRRDGGSTALASRGWSCWAGRAEPLVRGLPAQ